MITVLVVASLLPRLFGHGVVTKQPVPRMLSTANCSAEWQQCGGTDWAGSVCCQEGLWCFVQNEWYSQCVSSESTTTTHSVQVTSSELSTTNNDNSNSVDCVDEHNNAVNNGNIPCFCKRCANEGGADPLRDRCRLCYDVCNMTQVYNTTECPNWQNNRSDCVVEHENAVNNGNISAFCNRCANEGGANPLRDRCQLCYDACDELEPGPSPSVAYDGECRGNDSRCPGSSQVRCLNLGAQGADCWWDSFDPTSTGTCTGNDSRCHWAVSEQACANVISEGGDCVWREDFSLTGHVDMEVTGEVDVDEMEGAVAGALSVETGVPPENIDVGVTILSRRLEGRQLRQLQSGTTMRAFWSVLVDSNVFSVTRDSSEMLLQVSDSNNLEAAILSDLRGKHASEDLKVIVKNIGDVEIVIVSISTSTPNTDSNSDDKTTRAIDDSGDTTPATIVSTLSTTKRMGTTEPDYKALENAIDSSQSEVLNFLILLPALVTLL